MTKTDIKVGLIFLTQYLKSTTIKVLSIDRENNVLMVEIIPDSPLNSSWEEDWNLEHTEWGFERGEYTVKDQPYSYEVQVKSLMREYFDNFELSKQSMGVHKIEVEFRPEYTEPTLFVTVDLQRPGLFIGLKGRTMDELQQILERKTGKKILFKLNEVKDPWY
jgi:hypothetical protein